MTEIDFYSGGDRLAIACRLVAKAIRKGLKVLIYTSDVAMVDRIDKLLWTFTPTDFVPHCRDPGKSGNASWLPVCLLTLFQ